MIASAQEFFDALKASTAITAPVELPDGRKTFVRKLSAHERTQYDVWISDKDTGAVYSTREAMVCLCACDENGKRLFEDKDITRLGQLDFDAIEPIFTAAFRLNGFMPTSPEDIKKNSEAAPTGGLPSISA